MKTGMKKEFRFKTLMIFINTPKICDVFLLFMKVKKTATKTILNKIF